MIVRRGRPRRVLVAVGLMLTALTPEARAQDPYTVEIPDLERRWWSIGGHVEVRPVVFDLDQQSAAYRLRFFAEPDRVSIQTNAQLLLDAAVEKGPLALRARTVGDVARIQGTWQRHVAAYEAYLSWRPSPAFSLDAGKRTLKWGKGYAWNPAAFLDRPKNPDDPALALEGFWTLSGDIIRSGRGSLQTVSFTPVLVPVTARLNRDLGRPKGLHAAGRAYLLWRDTDIDVTFLAGPGAAPRFGIDVSRNVTSAVEVHAEVARSGDAVERIVAEDGTPGLARGPVTSMLIGVRFVIPSNTTFIVEQYHNGAGTGAGAFGRFITDVASAWDEFVRTGNTVPLTSLSEASQPYLRPTGMRDYLFVRVSQPDLFGIVYLNAAVTSIIHEGDGSFSLTQETLYRATANLELRSQISWLAGARSTDFGERQGNLRWEVRARYAF